MGICGLFILALGPASLLGISCSTTQGSLYGSTVSDDAKAAAEARRRAEEKRRKAAQTAPRPSPTEAPPPSFPETSKEDSDSNGGDLLLRLVFEAARAASSGRLVIAGLPPSARLFLDGGGIDRGGVGSVPDLLVPAGMHSLRAEAFGYLPWATSVEVQLRSTTTIEISMRAAPMSLGSVAASPAIFDPRAPGGLGRTSISFAATAPGRARFAVRDAQSRLVYESGDIAITEASTTAAWDGRDRRGRDLPTGEYEIAVLAMAATGSEVEARGSVTLSGNRTVSSHSSLAGGFGGPIFSPDARVLPATRVDISTGTMAVLDPSGGADSRLTSFAGMRLGFPGGRGELSLSGMAVVYPGYALENSADSGTLGVSLKTELSANDTWASALILGASLGAYLSSIESLVPSVWDGPARFPGLSAGLVVESDSEIARAFASIQAEASAYYPGYDPLAVTGEGLYVWSYLRGGLEFGLPDFLGSDATLALSLAGRTSPFNTGFSLALPLSMAVELHYYLPASTWVLSAFASGEWASKHSFYLGGGLGLGRLL